MKVCTFDASIVQTRQSLLSQNPLFALSSPERTALIICFSAVLIAYLLPYPATKIVLGAGLSMLFVGLSLRHFYIAVALFTFFLPLQTLLPQGSFLLRGLNVQTILVLGMFALSVIAASDARKHDKRAVGKNVIAKPLCGLIIVMLLSALHSCLTTSASFGDLFQSIKNGFIYSAFAFFTFSHIRDDRQKVFVLLFILVTTTLTAAESLHSVLGEGFEFNPVRHRAGSLIHGQPNLWGGFLAMYAFFFIATILHCPMSKTLLVLTYGALGVVLADLVYTMSRGAWLAFGISAVVVGGVKARRMFVPLLLIAGGLYLWSPDFAVARFYTGFEGEYDLALLMKEDIEEEEAASRIIQWRSFLPLASQYGLFGAGLGRYGEVYHGAGYDVKARSAHATIIETGIEDGILGLVFYFWIFLAVYRRASTVLREAESSVARVLALGVAGATVCLLLLDLTGTRSRDGHVMVFYWILAGMMLNIPLKADSPPGPALGSPPSRTGPRRRPASHIPAPRP